MAEWAIIPAYYESLLSVESGKVFVIIAQDWHNGAAGQTTKMVQGTEWTRLNWNAYVYKGEVQVEIWLKSQIERKILKFSKYEKHFSPEEKIQPITISHLHVFAHIVSRPSIPFPSSLLSCQKAFKASSNVCP